MKVQVKAGIADSEGVWAQHTSGAKFLIARAGNSKFLSSIDKHERPYRKQRNRGTLSTEAEIEIQCRAMAEGILRGWQGISTDDGPLEYSQENAFLVLRHNAELREFVTDFASTENNYRQEDIDETAKK